MPAHPLVKIVIPKQTGTILQIPKKGTPKKLTKGCAEYTRSLVAFYSVKTETSRKNRNLVVLTKPVYVKTINEYTNFCNDKFLSEHNFNKV